jgi:hypothetical protein
MMLSKSDIFDNNDEHRNRILESATTSGDYPIVVNTLDWLQNVVMGLNLCPFAKPSFVRDQINIQVVHGGNPTDALAHVVEECWKLKGDDKEGTALVVCPDLYPDDFEEFLGILNVLEEGIMEDLELSEDLQIAPFHPLFVFGDQEEDSGEVNGSKEKNVEDAISSYTNRAPYPMFHILREMEISKAVESLGGDASKVWKRNIELLQSMEDEFSGNTDDSNKTEAQMLRSAILKGKFHQENVITERIQRVLKKFKKERT